MPWADALIALAVMGGIVWLLVRLTPTEDGTRRPYRPKREDINSTTLEMPPSPPAPRTKRTSRKSRASVLEKAYTDSDIRQVVSQGYQLRRTVTMQYETANPLPGRRAINIRDVDVYGLGKDYFDAFCHLRDDMRIFKISRVRWAHATRDAYEIPLDYMPSTLDGVSQETSDTAASGATSEKWRWRGAPDHWADSAPNTATHEKPQLGRRKATPSEREEGLAKSPVRHDYSKRFQDGIVSPFPEELTPASPYLHEAYRLEQEGADQVEIDQVLDKAEEIDSRATDYYRLRQSIIKKRKAK